LIEQPEKQRSKPRESIIRPRQTQSTAILLFALPVSRWMNQPLFLCTIPYGMLLMLSPVSRRGMP
jgi:hypothetical protein